MSPTRLNFNGSPGQRGPNPNASANGQANGNPDNSEMMGYPGQAPNGPNGGPGPDMGPGGPPGGASVEQEMVGGGGGMAGGMPGGDAGPYGPPPAYGEDADFEAMVRAEMEKLRPQPPRGVSWGPGVDGGGSEMEPPYPPVDQQARQQQQQQPQQQTTPGVGRGKWAAPYVPHGQGAVDDSLEFGSGGGGGGGGGASFGGGYGMSSPDPMEKSMAAESFLLPRNATTTTPTGGVGGVGGVGSGISRADANPYDPQVVGGRFAGVAVPGVNLPMHQAAVGSLRSHSVHTTNYASNSPGGPGGPGGAEGGAGDGALDAQDGRSFPRQQAPGQGFSLSRGTGGLEEIDAFVDNWQRDHPIAGGGVPGITHYGGGAGGTGLSPRILGKDSQLVEQSLGGESMLMYLRQMEAAEAKARARAGGGAGAGAGAGGSEMYAHLGGLSPDDPFAQLAAARPPSVGVGYGHGSGLGGDGGGVGGLAHAEGGFAVEAGMDGRQSPLQGLLSDHPEVKTMETLKVSDT